MKQTSIGNKVLSGVLMVALCLGLTVVPSISGLDDSKASALEMGSSSQLQASTLDAHDATLRGSSLYFGSYLDSSLIFDVVAADSETITLLSGTAVDNRAYGDNSEGNGAWADSSICSWLNNDFLMGFSSIERTAIPAYGEREQANPFSEMSRDIDISQKVVLPSVLEMTAVTEGKPTNAPGLWSLDQAMRTLDESTEWLRSPGDEDNHASYIQGDGSVAGDTDAISNAHAIRPALKILRSSILFASQASAEGKSAVEVSGTLQAVEPSKASQKLTLIDSESNELSLTKASVDNNYVKPGAELTLDFEGAATGVGKYVSCVLINNVGSLVYYAKLSEGETQGRATIALPDGEDLPKGDYTLRVFNELITDDTDKALYTRSDYASKPIDIKLAVDDKPHVVNVTPNGDEVALEGTIVISFDTVMDTATQGSVSLVGANATLANEGTWSEDKMSYSLKYLALQHYKVYSFQITDFKDAAGNVLDPIISTKYSFRTIKDPAKPYIDSISPLGNKVAIEGTIEISFDEPMDTSAEGTVTLEGGRSTLDSSGSWSSDKMSYSIGYSGLEYDLSYTYMISGFKNEAGGELDEIREGYTFRTEAPDYEYRTLTDTETGVSITGHFRPNVALKVATNEVHLLDSCDACDAIRAKYNAKTLMCVHNITPEGDYQVPVTVSIPVGNDHNNQSVTIMHCKETVLFEGASEEDTVYRRELEERQVVIENGFVTAEFDTFSPFAVTTPGSATSGSSTSPKTSDAVSLATMAGLLGTAVVAMVTTSTAMRRRKEEADSE